MTTLPRKDGDDDKNAVLLSRLFLSLTDALLRRLLVPACALTLTLQGDQYSRWRVGCAARTAFWHPTRVGSPFAQQLYTPMRASSSSPIPMDGSARRYEFRCCLAALARKCTDQGVVMGPQTSELSRTLLYE